MERLKLRSIEDYKHRFYCNPQAINLIGDPNILNADDGYHLYATKGGKGFFHWHTNTLCEWSVEKQPALACTGWADGKHWAPEVSFVDGRYVMVYSAQKATTDYMTLGIAFAQTPEGPFHASDKPLIDLGYSVIDASIFRDDDGATYLFYSRDCSQYRPDGMRQSHTYGAPMKPDLSGVESEPVLVSKPEEPWEKLSQCPIWNEGGCMLKHANKYYLFYSANYFAEKYYCVGCSIADHPLGPFTKYKKPLISWIEGSDGITRVAGPGHNSFFTVGEELFTAYHTLMLPEKPDGTRQLCYDRAGFHKDGTPYVNGPTLEPQLLPLAELGHKNHALYASSPSQALNDGDIALSPLSEERVWKGKQAQLTFAKPVEADMILLFPSQGCRAKGVLVINDCYEAPVDFSSIGANPGRAQIIAFDEISVTSVRLCFETEAILGEVMVIGPAKQK